MDGSACANTGDENARTAPTLKAAASINFRIAGPLSVELTLGQLDMGVPAKFNAAGRARHGEQPDVGSDDAAALLVQLYGFKQRLKVSFAEAIIAFALNDFKEDGA